MISAVIAAFNEEACIAKTIESFLNQSYKDFELIIVDDGSTDSTPEIIKDYASRDSRIKPYFPGKLGKNGAFNYGVGKSTGDWFMLFAGDDLVDENIMTVWSEKAGAFDPQNDEAVLLSRIRMFAEDPEYKSYDGIEVPKDPSRGCTSGAAFLATAKMRDHLYPIPTDFPNEDGWISLFFEFVVKPENKVEVPAVCTHYRIHGGNSLNKNAAYKEFNEKYHKRALVTGAFKNRFKDCLSDSQLEVLSRREELEEKRYNHKTAEILFMNKLSPVERFRNVFLSNPVLYFVKLKANRFMLGR